MSHTATWILVVLLLVTCAGAMNQWNYITSQTVTPPGRIYHSLVTDDHGKIVLFGGADTKSCQVFTDLWTFDASAFVMCFEIQISAKQPRRVAVSAVWDPFELHLNDSSPGPRYAHTAVALGDMMYVFGGSSILRERPRPRNTCEIEFTGDNDMWAFSFSTPLYILLPLLVFPRPSNF
jgi:hypothetical protein